MIWFSMGVLVGALLMWGWQHKPKRKANAPTPVKAKTYGHPHAPVPYLKKELPDPPTGFFWEVRIAAAERDGTPFLHLALIDATTGKSVGDTKADLVNSRFRTFAADYRNYGNIKGHIFKSDLIGPLMDWAALQVNKHTDPNLISEYTVES